MYRDIQYTKISTLNTEIFKQEISYESLQILDRIFSENPEIKNILLSANSSEHAKIESRRWVMRYLQTRLLALNYYNGDYKSQKVYEKLSWRDIAAIRLLDYIDHEGSEHEDLNLGGEIIINAPVKILYNAAKYGTGGATPDFFRDMLHLFRQFSGLAKKQNPTREQLDSWMAKHPSGLDPQIIEQRKKNRDRIIKLFIKKIDAGDIQRSRFKFDEGMTYWQKYKKMLEWWNDRMFHLQFAAKTPERLNRMLDRSLDEETMDTFFKAQDSGIPFFVNPYYLSLLNVDVPEELENTDAAIRDYVFVNKQLVNEFGNIVAWEKEDVVEPGKPNAAGWLLPNRRNIHRRYPEVAILIPDTTGRACGGLCVSCQRMYDFQDGHLNFDLEELKPVDSWWERLPKLLRYFEKDSHLQDILITGGDALMSTDNALRRILDEVYNMAARKRATNKLRSAGKKYAPIQRVRLGTRLPVYIPQRITDNLIQILADFKEKASKIGIKQFVIQTHFQSPMEVTPESAEGVKRLISAGWLVTNQLVFTAPSSRRGHTAKLRKVLNDIGVITYYTFSVKGYLENAFMFTNNARAVQEQIEEKHIGGIPGKYHDLIKEFPANAEEMVENIESLRQICDIPFLASDRNVMNLPGVGKSLTFRTIGITNDGRRILEFDYDRNRNHSPIIHKMGKVVIIESRSLTDYLNRLKELGEDMKDYQNVWGYSIGETEQLMSVFQYPEFKHSHTKELTNLEV